MPSSMSGKPQKAPVVLARPSSAAQPAKPSPAVAQQKTAPPATNGKAPAAAASSSAASAFKPPPSKTANGKLPNPANSNGAPPAPAPAKPKVDLMSLSLVQFLEDPDAVDPQHQRSLDSMFDEWKCNHLHAEVADCLSELNQPYTHAVFVFNVVTQCCDRGAHFVSKCSELLDTLIRKQGCLNAGKMEEALRHASSQELVADMSLDCPSYRPFMIEILAQGLFITQRPCYMLCTHTAPGMSNRWLPQSFECDLSLAARDAAERMGESAESGEDIAES